MTKKTILATALVALLTLVPLLAGCGGGGEEESAAPAEKAASAETVATHDCAGDCGMTNAPEDQMTEIDGKWYCTGCAAKLTEEEDHSGHDHG